MIADELIVGGVLAMRFLVPLTILRYPLPGILASILADALDGAIFAGFTDVSLEHYQAYDKALDIYYLAIAYVATLRNWTDPTAIRIGQFLWYYRLVGVALFAALDERALLFVFPATFEYYFIFYESVRTRWWQDRLRTRHLVGAVAFSWIVLKLPQEYWVHVVQGSTTEWMKEIIFGVPPTASRIDAVAANPAAAAALLLGLVLVVALGWLSLRWLPQPDHATVFDANVRGPGGAVISGQRKRIEPILTWALFEKIALVSLTSIVFAEFLPGVEASAAQMIVAVSIFIIVNAAVSDWIARHGGQWRAAAFEFLVMSVVNAAIILGVVVLSFWTDATIDGPTALFYALLFTLFITLYDRYRHLNPWGLGRSALDAPRAAPGQEPPLIVP